MEVKKLLTLSRKVNQICRINDDIIIKIIKIEGNQVKIGFQAPKSTKIHREEIYRAIKQEQDNERLS